MEKSADTDGDIKDLKAMANEELLEMNQKLRQMGIARDARRLRIRYTQDLFIADQAGHHTYYQGVYKLQYLC